MIHPSVSAIVKRAARQACTLIVMLSAAAIVSHAQNRRAYPATIRNYSFEYSDFTGADGLIIPDSWRTSSLGNVGGTYKLGLDSAEHFDGKMSLRSIRRDIAPSGTSTWGEALAEQFMPLRAAPGATLRMSAWIRTVDVADGFAGPFLRIVDVSNKVLRFDNAPHGATGTTAWTRYVVELPVDSGAALAFFGVQHKGTGTAWFDSVRLEVITRPAPSSTLPPGLLRQF